MTGRASRRTTIDTADPQSVLIVDDDELVCERLAAVLLCAGYDVQTAGSAEQALLYFERSNCSIVIADWEMPVMDGLSLCRAIRRVQGATYVYVLLFTIRRESHDVIAGFAAGADDFIVKGVPDAEFVARLQNGRRLISKHKAPVIPGDSRATQAAKTPGLAVDLAEEYERCSRRGVPLSVLLCAPDNFAQLRECAGTRLGSEFMARLRAEIPKLLLESEWLARCGAEGFLVVLPGAGVKATRLVAERIRAAIAANGATLTWPVSITVSIGAASVNSAEELQRFRPAHLLRTSEQCLARSREHGGNRVTAARVR